ncbi:UNVERIFIED_CONTAM: hypothetical protein FKN15_025552 [Acipenser sinensis]
MENIKAELKTAEKFALTSDIWTSLAIEAYMSVTAHFITKDWQFKTINLATNPLAERHTGENIVTWIEEVLNKFELEAPLMNNALKVTTIDRVVGAARCLVDHFHRSEAASSALKNKRQQMSVPQHSLKQDVSTRWNSTLHMVTRLLEQRWPVTAVLSDSSKTAKCQHYPGPAVISVICT